MSAADKDLRFALRDARLLAIIRGTDPAACVRTAMTLIEEGVSLLEVSLTSVEAFSVLDRVTSEAADEARVGPGRVLPGAGARRARAAGATCPVTPALGAGVTTA